MTDKTSFETVKGSLLRANAFGVTPFGLVLFGAAVADEETITIGSDVYEFDTGDGDGTYTATNIRVDVSGGATASAAAAALKAAINANTAGGVTAADGAGDSLVLTFTGVGAGNGTLAITETMAQAGNLVQSIGQGLGYGVGSYKYVADAVDVAEGQIVLDFTPPPGKTLYDTSVSVVSVSDGTVTKKAWDGAVAIATNVATIDNSGSTDWAAADILLVSPVFG
jgi:hypothetical protein